MDIVFIDTAGWAFDPDTPFERPLGGSQSAACYLAPELAKLGHRVTLASRDAERRLVRGVHCEPVPGMQDRILQDADCVVHVGGVVDARLAEFTALCGPNARLEVYSSMAVYNALLDPFQPLYEAARNSPGVAYHGSVAQPALAQALRGATMLAYPNTFGRDLLYRGDGGDGGGLHRRHQRSRRVARDGRRLRRIDNAARRSACPHRGVRRPRHPTTGRAAG